MEMIAEKNANMGQGARTDLKHSETSQKFSQEEAAKQLGTTPKAITHARRIRNGRHDKLTLMPIPSNPPVVHNLLTTAPI
jgi:hypothetical protein